MSRDDSSKRQPKSQRVLSGQLKTQNVRSLLKRIERLLGKEPYLTVALEHVVTELERQQKDADS